MGELCSTESCGTCCLPFLLVVERPTYLLGRGRSLAYNYSQNAKKLFMFMMGFQSVHLTRYHVLLQGDSFDSTE